MKKLDIKIAIKHQQELEKQYNGLNEKELLQTMKDNNVGISNYEKGEYLDFETKYFTTTYDIENKQLRKEGIQFWNETDEFIIIDL